MGGLITPYYALISGGGSFDGGPMIVREALEFQVDTRNKSSLWSFKIPSSGSTQKNSEVSSVMPWMLSFGQFSLLVHLPPQKKEIGRAHV